jgi:Mrp family chromosome partitioning ATPase
MSHPPRSNQFGNTAVRLGYVGGQAIEDALGEQAQQRGRGNVVSPIGLLLQEKGLLTPEQITAVLRQLSGGELPLSEDGIRLAARLKVIHAAASNLIGVTAAVPQDATRTIVELAVGLAVMEQGRVLLVDANVREPSVHTLLEVPAAPGLLEHITQGIDAPPPLATRLASLSVVPAGAMVPDAVSLCMSPETAAVIDAYRAQYRYVLVNLGQVTRQPEAAVTASRCDGVVVVLRAGTSQKSELRDMQQLLSGLKVSLSGVVLARPFMRREPRTA